MTEKLLKILFPLNTSEKAAQWKETLVGPQLSVESSPGSMYRRRR